MNSSDRTTRVLWDRYLATRSNENHTALVEHYMPIVQMQTALWAYGLEASRTARRDHGPTDGLAEPAAETMFLPFVPPAAPRRAELIRSSVAAASPTQDADVARA